MIKNIA